jgi:potassium efflux system protein
VRRRTAMISIPGKLHGLFRFPQVWSVIAVVAILFLAAVPGRSAEQKSPEPGKISKPAAPAAVPLAEIAPSATQVTNLLQTFATKLAPNPAIESIQKSLPDVVRQINSQYLGTIRILESRPTLATLQSEQQFWQQNQLRITTWLSTLTERAEQLDAALSQLAPLQKTWTLTLDATQAAKAPEPIIQQAQQTLAAIAAAGTPLQAQRATILDLQSRVARESVVCGNVLAQIALVQRRVVGGTFERNSPPIWSSQLWAQARKTIPFYVGRVGAAIRADFETYLGNFSKWMFHAGLFVVLVLVFWAMRRQVRQWETASRTELSAAMVFEHPFAAALALTLITVTSPFAHVPVMVWSLLEVLAFAPMIILIRPVLRAQLVYVLYLLGTLFAIDTARQAFAGVPLIGQAILAFESFLGMVVLGWLLTFGSPHLSDGKKSETGRSNGLRLVGYFVLLAFTVSLMAAAAGYTNLARLLTPGIVAGGATALVLYVSVRMATGVVAFAFRIWPMRNLHMVQNHRDLLEKRIYRIFLWLGTIGWTIRFLDYMGLLEPTLSTGRAFLAMKLERGAISISVEDVLLFLLTILLSYVVSSFIRFVLQEDVYPRVRVAPGESYAISSLLHYIILTVGFLIAIGLLGVNLTKVTVLAASLGVGIGFGLQGVVNNFVSGLILLFERPIHAGDTIEVGNLLGEVRRIGMRASRVHTWEGSDIIVPNSQLVSDKVTNWTLSDRLKRIDLSVGVSYGTDPRVVIGILESTSGANPRILKSPPPEGHFLGYGDSSINFQLWVWTDQFHDWPRIRSELAVAVYDAVYAAGITFPFPQRDVHLRDDSVLGILRSIPKEKQVAKRDDAESTERGKENDGSAP